MGKFHLWCVCGPWGHSFMFYCQSIFTLGMALECAGANPERCLKWNIFVTYICRWKLTDGYSKSEKLYINIEDFFSYVLSSLIKERSVSLGHSYF